MALKTILSLAKESAKLKNRTLPEKARAFRTLFTLYFKSKFYRKTPGIIAHSIAGYRVYGYDYYNLIFLYREIFLGQAYQFQSANQKPFIIDCGANIGMSVLYFKKVYPESEIYAFEPNPDAFELLHKNVTTNALNGVSLFNCALSDVEGQVDFFIPNKKGALYASLFQEHGMKKKITVDVKKLSSFIRNKSISFIKMDVEGAEISIVEELISSQTIHQVDQFVIEFHTSINPITAEVFFSTYFEKNGFRYTVRPNEPAELVSKDILMDLSQKNNIPDVCLPCSYR